MPPERADDLFAQYAAAYARGERPRAREFLERAGAKADAFAALLERFLEAAPVPAPAEDDIAAMRALAGVGPSLAELRVRRGIRVDEVVDALVERIRLDPEKRAKVKRYYQRLEQGLLDPAGVSRKVWAVVSDLLGREVWQHAGWQPSQRLMASAPYHQATPLEALDAAVPAAAPPPLEPDEIDRLFGGSSRP